MRRLGAAFEPADPAAVRGRTALLLGRVRRDRTRGGPPERVGDYLARMGSLADVVRPQPADEADYLAGAFAPFERGDDAARW